VTELPDGLARRGLDFRRLYEYRHRGVHPEDWVAVWNEIAAYVYDLMGRPERVLDPAAGWGEFINAVPAPERWMIDAVEFPEHPRDPAVKAIFADIGEVDLPSGFFEGVFVSNFLEHLATPDDIADFLAKMREAMAPSGRIVVVGPNFRYVSKQYFDFADHRLALTHVTVMEHLAAAGFDIESVAPRFLPYSFTGRLPPRPELTRLYLKLRLAWPVLGKQFLVVGRVPGDGSSR
jgi:SAM-dependent methyltransferase